MKRWWVWAMLGVALLLISSGRTWATGTWPDPVLGATLIEATGTDVGGTLTAGALLGGAALLAGLVGSRPVRLVAACALAGGAALAGLPAIMGLLSPRDALEALAADRPGAASLTIRVNDAAPTVWPWIGLLGAILLLVSALLCGGAAFRTPRSQQPAEASASPGQTAERTGQTRHRDPWDDLTRGDDPTLDT